MEYQPPRTIINKFSQEWSYIPLLSLSHITRFMWPIWGPPGSCRPRWAPCWPHESCYRGWQVCTYPCWAQMSEAVHWQPVMLQQTATVITAETTNNLSCSQTPPVLCRQSQGTTCLLMPQLLCQKQNMLQTTLNVFCLVSKDNQPNQQS